MQCVENCNDPDPRNHVLYEQPVWQTLQMFRASLYYLTCPVLQLTSLARPFPSAATRMFVCLS